MITRLTWQQYVKWLHVVEGYSLDEAKAIVNEQYSKQWGYKPTTHEAYIKRMWEIETTKQPTRKVKVLQ